MNTIVTVEVKNAGTGPYLEVAAKQIPTAPLRAANHQLLVSEIRRAIRMPGSPFVSLIQPQGTTTAE